MKRLLNVLFVLILLAVTAVKVNALNFEQAFSQTNQTPMVVLVYAQWADGYQNYLQQFRTVQSQFSNNFNFVEMDIASRDTKAFNDRYHIYPNLPYILMFRDSGRVSRYIPRACASSASCISSKLKSFIL